MRSLRAVALALALTLALVPGQGARAEASPAAAVERLFGPGPLDPAWFDPAFLQAVSAERLAGLIAQMTVDFGGLTGLRLEGGAGTLELERAAIPVTVTLDPQGRIAGLFFGVPQAASDTPAALADSLRAAAVGETAALALSGGAEIVATGAETPMAVGSAFKLWVLAAYEAAVAEGRLARDGVARIEARDRSLPSGVLQTLAPGTPVTHETLAALMIQHSDNTATDMLMRILGRPAVEAAAGGVPVPTTAELFKLAADAQARAAYAAGDDAARRAILAGLAEAPLPAVGEIGRTPTWREAEWRMTARAICGLLEALRDAPALNGAPDPLVAAEGWGWNGFKGGSELGVLNLSAAGVTPDGRRVCAVFTANGDGAQPEARLATLFAALFRSLGR